MSTFENGQLILDRDFKLFQSLFYSRFGLYLSDQKKLLMSGRLGKRIKDLELDGYHAYYELITKDEEEFQVAINRITTNETYFFREPKQFEVLRDQVVPLYRGANLKIWSAACSTGEEPYSIAMVLSHHLGNSGWSILASDINTRVLEAARVGLYSMERIEGIPNAFLKTFCLKGLGEYVGKLMIDRTLKSFLTFQQMNLTQLPSGLGTFQVIFLRNAIIYFDGPTKEKVLRSICDHLVPGGWLFLGHSESLANMNLPLSQVIPSVFRKQ